MADSDNRVAIWVAIIALVGTLGAAVISNVDKLKSLFTMSTGQNPSARRSTAAHDTTNRSSLRLAKKSFEFPGDGQKNNNRTIGDFCCTGETAIIQTSSGSPLGYIYFYDFPGG